MGQSVTLAWDSSPDTNVVGYNIYMGVTSGTYTTSFNVGNVTTTTVSGLIAGATYYFVATAYDNLGEESGFSDEIVYSVPTGAPAVQIHPSTAGQFILTINGLGGRTYEIQATQDLKTWTSLGNVTMGSAGSLDFTDTNAANFAQRFYRILSVP